MIKKRVAVLISGRGSNMEALIEAARDASFPAEIALVLSNRPDAQGLSKARADGLVADVVDHRPFGADREAFERAVHVKLEANGVDLVCLAGFMRVLTPWLVERWENRMLNIHPALLPSFKGVHTHERALAAGVKIHGATAHFVVPEMDSGPIIAQAAVPVHDDDTPETLAARVLTVEHRLYPLALKLVAQDRVRIADGRCFIDTAKARDAALCVPSS